MSDYTPSRSDVREMWTESQDITHGRGQDFHEAEFDRWLAAHDAATRTATLDEAAVIVKGNLGRIWIVAETLGDIAAAIRASKVDPR